VNLSQILKQNIAGKLINHGIVFLINVVIVRSLQTAESGHFFNNLYLINFLAFLFSAGLDYSAIAWISKEPLSAPAIHKKLIEIVLFFTAVMMIVSFVIIPQTSLKLYEYSTAMVLFSSGNLMLILYQGFLSAQKKFNLQNIILGSSNLCFLIYLLMKPNGLISISIISLGYGLLYFIQGLLIIVLSYQKQISIQHQIEWPAFYKHGLFIMISSLVYFCFLRTDNFFVEKYCSGKTLSNYVQCGKVGQYFIYFSSAISSTLLPFLSSEKITSSYQEWKQLIKPYFLLIIIGAIILIFSGKYIYPFVFGNDFIEMNNYMIILLPGFVSLGLLTLINAVYLSKGNVKQIFKGDIIGFIIVLVADTFLVPQYGVYAAATVSSISYVIVFLYLWKDVRKQFNES
jgi:O-antigen/teichoic acid export membrane protein